MRQKHSSMASLVRAGRRLLAVATAIAATALLSACSTPSLPSFGGLFAEKEEILPGKRIAVLQNESPRETTDAFKASGPVVLPPAVVNSAWSQPGGAPNNAPGHLGLTGSVKSAWSVDAGSGSSKSGRLTAVPVVADGKVFTLDTEGTVSAFSLGSGNRLWRVSLKPEKERSRLGFGGGLALDGGRLFAATGYGTIVALDPSSGKVAWTKSYLIPFRNSPTAANGKVFAVNTESLLVCLNAADGSELWTARGLPETATMISNVSPAVAGDVVVVPYPSGEIAAFDINTGAARWTDGISRSTVAQASFAGIAEPARPVIDGNAVFAISRSGRMIATERSSGERLWSRDISGAQTPWVAGDSIFVVDLNGQLMALSRKDGKTRWSTSLPDSKTWAGPVLAGGRLWLASDKGTLVSVDAASGAIASKADLGTPVYISPVVVAGKLLVMTDKARLIAMN